MYKRENTKKPIERSAAWKELCNELFQLKNKEIILMLNGRISGPVEIANKFFGVQKGYTYMPDYIFDERGRLHTVSYDRVKCN